MSLEDNILLLATAITALNGTLRDQQADQADTALVVPEALITDATGTGQPELATAIAALNGTLRGQQADQADIALTVPKFLTKGAKALVPAETLAPSSSRAVAATSADDLIPEALITDATGTGEPELTKRQLAARKAAATRKANKEAMAQAEVAAKATPDAAEPLRQLTREELGYKDVPTADPFSAEENDPFNDDFEPTEVNSFDAFGGEVAPITVMTAADPRAALRGHLNTIARELGAIGEGEKVVELMRGEFGTNKFSSITKDKFDAFLNAAINLLPEDKKGLIS